MPDLSFFDWPAITPPLRESPSDLPMLTAALELAAGGMPVFPCGPDKTPMVATGFHAATTDPDTITAWWRRWPEAMVAVPTGEASGLLVVDVDIKNNGAGNDSLIDLEHALGELPKSWAAETPSGGWHYFFKRPDDTVVRSSAGTVAPGIDIRGEGGYVVVAPSINGRGAYRWEQGAGPSTPLAYLPAPWLERLTTPPRPEPVAGGDAVHVAEGGRNVFLTSLAGALRRKGATAKAITGALLAANGAQCHPPLPDDEVQRIAASVARYTPEQDGPGSVAVPPFNADRARLHADIFATPPPRPLFVVERYLPVDVAALVAPGGTGKTTLVQYEGVHIALGLPLYGLTIERPGPVVFITGEDDKAAFEHRLYHLVEGLGLTPAQRDTLRANIYIEDVSGRLSRLVEMDRAGNLIFTDLVSHIIDAYSGIQPALINFDPLVSFGPGERIVNDGEQAVVVALRRIVAALGCCCRVVHHTGQAVHRERIVDLYSGRGGSSLGDGVRSQSQLVLHTTGDKLQRPPGILYEDIEAERVLRLHINKLTHAKRPKDPIWLVRNGWTFEHHAASTEDAEAGRRRQEREDTEVVLSYLRRRLAEKAPIKHTRRSLEDAYADIGIPRNRVRTIADMAIQRGDLAELELSREEQHGRRTHYLRPQS